MMVFFNVVSDICFMVDICLNFRTGYMAPGGGSHIVLSPKLIAKRYDIYKKKHFGLFQMNNLEKCFFHASSFHRFFFKFTKKSFAKNLICT